MIYTGIGSRETPIEVLEVFKNIGKYLGEIGYILRSGGADGADNYFEIGCDISNGKKEIYLPWKNFNNNNSDLYFISDEALKMAERYHPYWNNLSDGARKLQARNCYQVLGYNLDTPTDFIICYTKDGKLKGGTSQALRIAKDYDIKVFNAGNYNDLNDFRMNLWNYIKEINYGNSPN